MNATAVLLSILLPNIVAGEPDTRALLEVAYRLASEAYKSPLYSVRQIYTVDVPNERVQVYEDAIPQITVHEWDFQGWKLENAVIIVRISSITRISVLDRVLASVVDAEKILFIVIADFGDYDESFIKQLSGTMFHRGVLNFSIVGLHQSFVILSKYDTVSKRMLTYDGDTPVENIFPPILRTLAGHQLKVLLTDNYPYAYKLASRWDGMDALILYLLVHRFKCSLRPASLNLDGSNALHRMEMIQKHLERGTVDINIPRAHYTRKDTAVSVARAYEWESLVLVVPKSDQLNLTNIMLEPFSIEVWSMVICYLLVKQFFKLLSFIKRHCWRQGSRRTLCSWGLSLGSMSGVAVEVISFVLIETYLAKITELLLYCRFRADPQTLDEFFRSDISIVIPEYMDPLVQSFDAAIYDQFVGKRVRPQEAERMPVSCCARIHTLPRAEYIIRMVKYFDMQLGRKQLYILPEHLKTIPMSYLLGRNFAFKNSFELFLLQVYESGLMEQYIKGQRADVVHMERNFFSKGWLTLDDLVPLFVLIAAGWCCSCVGFAIEVFGVRMKHSLGRRYRKTGIVVALD